PVPHRAGRPHSRPASAVAGLQRFERLAQSLVRYDEQVADEVVFTKIAEMAPDDVTEILLVRLKSTQAHVEAARDVIHTAEGRLKANIERVEGILIQRAEQAAGALAEEDEAPLQEEPGEDDEEVGEEGEADEEGRYDEDELEDDEADGEAEEDEEE